MAKGNTPNQGRYTLSGGATIVLFDIAGVVCTEFATGGSNGLIVWDNQANQNNKSKFLSGNGTLKLNNEIKLNKNTSPGVLGWGVFDIKSGSPKLDKNGYTISFYDSNAGNGAITSGSGWSGTFFTTFSIDPCN
jgi:hypothetical protein